MSEIQLERKFEANENFQKNEIFDFIVTALGEDLADTVVRTSLDTMERGTELLKQDVIWNELEVKFKKLSPHRFGIPQIRERMFIVCSRNSLNTFEWPSETPNIEMSIESILDKNPDDAKRLTPQLKRCLSTWQKFIKTTIAALAGV